MMNTDDILKNAMLKIILLSNTFIAPTYKLKAQKRIFICPKLTSLSLTFQSLLFRKKENH